MIRKLHSKRTVFEALMVICFVLAATFAFAQEEPPGEPSLGGEFVGLTFAAGLTTALVQLLRRTGAVDYVPGFVRPLIAAGIGIGAVYLSNLIGMEVDLSPIAALFAAGGGGALLFDIGKEAGVLKSTGDGRRR